MALQEEPYASDNFNQLQEVNDLLHMAQSMARIGIWKYRISEQVLEWSDEIYRIYGVSRDSFTPSFEAIMALQHPEDVPMLVASGQAARQEIAEMDLKHRIIRPDGELRYVYSRGKVVTDSQNHSYFLGTIQDITESRLSRDKLHETEALVHIAGEMAGMGGWEIDIGGGSVRWSDQVCQIHEMPLGSTPDLDDWLRFYAPHSSERLERLLAACADHGTHFDTELEGSTLTGRPLWVRVIGQAVRQDEQPATRIRGALQDITDKKGTQDKVDLLAATLATTLETMTDAFLTLDRNWNFTYLNRMAEQLLQRERGDVMGKNLWREFAYPIDGPSYIHYHKAISENCTVEFEEFYAPLGKWLGVLAYPSAEGLAVHFRDISESKHLLEAMRASEERFRIVAKATTDTIWDWDLQTDTIWWNEGMETLFGHCLKDIEPSSRSWSNRLHPDEQESVVASIHRAIDGKDEKWSEEYRFLCRNGGYAHVLDRGFIIRNSEGRAIRMVGSMIDLSALKQAESEQLAANARIRQQASLLDKAKDAIIVRGIDDRVHFWNKGAERLYGWTPEEALGRPIANLVVDDPDSFATATQTVIAHGEWSGETANRRRDGSIAIIEAKWTLVRDERGQPLSIFAIETDITRRKQAENEVEKLAYYDALTCLPNRLMLFNRLQKALAVSARSGTLGALLFIDLDNFKSLNDSLGHDQGDLLLKLVATRLSGCVGGQDFVARLGGDEYVVMLEALRSTDANAAAQAKMAGDTILESFTQPFELTGYKYFNTPSIGVALFHGQSDTPDDVMKRADMAMYQAKAAGRNTMRFFDPQMQAIVDDKAALEKDLRQAITSDEFVLHYQPQINGLGQVSGVEALVRWQQPQRGLVSPACFIPLAEDSGMIVQIGYWVLQSACAQLAAWANRPVTAMLTIAVNVSARQFRHPDFVAQVMNVLAATGADPSKLKLELTESLLVEDMEATIGKMDTLKALGVGFSLDDFGTGYSSLSYLRRLPLDQLKIDQSFVKDMLTDVNGAAIVRTILALGSALGLNVIAEGVETQAQWELLVHEGCAAFQGYHFSRPLPVAELEKFLLAHA